MITFYKSIMCESPPLHWLVRHSRPTWTPIYWIPSMPKNADTELRRVHHSVYVPPAYVPLFLSKPLSSREAWNTIQAQIVIDGRQVDCATLVEFLCCEMTRSTAGNLPVLAQTSRTAPIADWTLLDSRRSFLESDFSVLTISLTMIQQNQISGHWPAGKTSGGVSIDQGAGDPKKRWEGLHDPVQVLWSHRSSETVAILQRAVNQQPAWVLERNRQEP